MKGDDNKGSNAAGRAPHLDLPKILGDNQWGAPFRRERRARSRPFELDRLLTPRLLEIVVAVVLCHCCLQKTGPTGCHLEEGVDGSLRQSVVGRGVLCRLYAVRVVERGRCVGGLGFNV